MTLLIASIRRADVVLTADGRSTRRTDGVVTGVDDRYVKIHPVPEHPLAVAHHGENLLAGRPVAAFLAGFFATLNAGNHSVEGVADLLREYAHAAVRARLRTTGKGSASSFWVIGFGAGEGEPRGVEVFWKWEGDHLTVDEREWRPVTLATGGDGKRQLPPTSWREVDGKDVAAVRAYHKRLMDAAIGAEVKDNPVGGRVHEVVITPEKWAWSMPV
jgi:hypothetical protein